MSIVVSVLPDTTQAVEGAADVPAELTTTAPSTSELDRVETVSDGSDKKDSLKGNARVGTSTVRLVGGLSTQFNDNINYSENNRLSDFIITPVVELNLLWPVTDLNTLTFDIGASYDKYIQHPEADTKGINIAPDSNINFRAQVGEYVVLNFFDRFSFQQTPLDEPTISNTLDYSRFENTAGVELIWNINKALEYISRYTYGTWIAFDDAFTFLDRDTHTISNSIKFELNPALYTGLNTNVIITDYKESFQNDNIMLKAGPFVRAKVTENTELGGELNYVVGWFDRGDSGTSNNQDRENINNINFVGDITNRFNARGTQRLTAGYESILGTTSNFYDLAYARYDVAWQLFPLLSTDLQLFYEYGDESGSRLSEAFQRYGGQIKFSYRVTKSIVSSIGYRYTERDSDSSGQDYYQNVFMFDMDYRF
ncbi:MAG: hypothetical protein SFU85_05655 [Candidatus Methylacidiphilales bacterium]|nr:hypothetical protein [Candidatus Methylacidiphilales bacterium]